MGYNWKAIQNGSDIRGVAIEGVKGEVVNLNAEIVNKLGKAFVYWLQKNNYAAESPNIAVGVDSRISGPELKEAFINGIKAVGGEAIDCGLASTPAMFMSTQLVDIKSDAGVMLTASHLPFNRNGLKFFTKDGGLNKGDISAILKLAEEGNFTNNENKGKSLTKDLIGSYSKWMVKFIQNKTGENKPLNGLKIIVDAGNGAGGFFADKVLQPLGADTTGSQFLNPDGNFPNHIPNPEDKDAMNSICNAVIEQKADLGIIFDTDVDRSAVVDKYGNSINRNDLVALAAAIIVKEHPESTIVTDSITSKGLTEFIENRLNAKHHRFKRGYKNVINESIRLNELGEESWLAIETSGHAALKENFFLDDGAFLVAKILVEVSNLQKQGLLIGELINGLKRPVENEEFRIKITESDFQKYGNMVIKDLVEYSSDKKGWSEQNPNFEGVRVNCVNDTEAGWFLLRMSLHDPVLPLNIESDIEGGVEVIALELKNFFKKYSGLNIEDLN